MSHQEGILRQFSLAAKREGGDEQKKRSIQTSQASWDDSHWLGLFRSDSGIVEGQHESEYSKQ